MPSFDIVSEVDVQEVDNAVNQAQKEILNRFDFRGSKTELELDKPKLEIKLVADSDMRLDALRDVVSSKLVKRGIDLGSVDMGKVEQTGGTNLRQIVKLKQGLEMEVAKKIVKHIKDAKLKVEAQIQDKQIRVTGKKIDDLQTVISLLREKGAEMRLPLQYINMRS